MPYYTRAPLNQWIDYIFKFLIKKRAFIQCMPDLKCGCKVYT